MVNYQNAKIYKIWSPSTDKIFIGCTTENLLSQRIAHHISEYKRYLSGKDNIKSTSYDIISLGDAVIELIELFPCNSKDELLKRQAYHINLNKDICINKTVYNPKKPRFDCECGSQMNLKNKYIHMMSDMHKSIMLLKNNI